MNSLNCLIIDNCIVSKSNTNIISIYPIKLFKKMNPRLNIDSLRKITYGNRIEDNRIISQLSIGMLNFEDLI